MAIERVFLGWDGPCLVRAADWLRDRYASAKSWDLREVLVVTPNGRANRRLREVLLDQARGRLFFPPSLITPGELPEQLYEPALPIADDLPSVLAHVLALRSVEPSLLKRVVAEPPDHADVPGWLALARDLDSVHEALAAGAVPIEQVSQLCQSVVDFQEEDRWEAIAALRQEHRRVLKRHGLQDRHAARFEALHKQTRQPAGDIILIATADLDRITQRFLEKAGDRIWALIHAPAAEAAGFNELGCLIPAAWAERKLDLDPRIVRVVDRPRDQAYEILRILEGQGGPELGKKYAADQITIGLGDEAMGSLIERTLDFAQVPAHSSLGRSIGQTPPALLLAGLARYLRRERFDDLAALLRHPDIENHLLRTLSTSGENPACENVVADWLTLLDRYITEHLQGTLAKQWLGDPERAARLKAVYDAVRALAPDDFAKPRPLPQWSRPIAQVLEKIYGRRELDRNLADDQAIIRALHALGEALREQAQLGVEDELTPRLNFCDAVMLTLARLGSQQVHTDAPGPSIELLRWLELQLDDAPALIVTGVNEGQIPESVSTDTFLPDHLRRAMGLLDNRRRYARDMLMLNAILHSRPEVLLLAGRRSVEEDPLTPSRLLLACDEDRLAQRVLEFYASAREETASPEPAPPLLAAGKVSRFAIPAPRRDSATPLDSLRVTAFRDYLACPYRFYLRHILKLESSDDHATELDGAAFGLLAHQAMQAFGRSEFADATDPQAINAYLSGQLDRLAKIQFGAEPPAVVRIQIEQLRYRLGAVAQWQAQQSQEGWRVIPKKVEADLSVVLQVDGLPFTLTGRIDRIDFHPEQGYRILDYKTADSPKPPERAHRTADEWTDLQLPLYAALAQSLGLEGDIALGYVQIPKDLRQVGLDVAEWSPDELADALAQACEIIRKIRRGVFWPPSAPPLFVDEFGRICMDQCLDRQAAIATVSAQMGSPQ